jgi:hypothetical protein
MFFFIFKNDKNDTFRFLELRNNQNFRDSETDALLNVMHQPNKLRTHIKPCYRFEHQNNFSGVEVKIKISNVRSGAKFESEMAAPNKMFKGPTESQPFIQQDLVGNYIGKGFLIILINVEMHVVQKGENFGNHLTKLVDDLNAFIGDKEISDFTYRVDGEEFPVHRAILAGELTEQKLCETFS